MIHALVADDDEALRSLVSQVLRAEGYDVQVAADGDEAWRKFQDSLPEIVFADIRMPGRTGLELLAEIKNSHPLCHVIIMTSHASLETAIGALKSGAYDYLIKPFEDLELIAASARRALASVRLLREREVLVAKLKRHNEDLERLNRMFRELAVKDGLTGLFNHRHFHEALSHEVERSERYERPMSVLFLDLDHFKQYNDRNGHQKGDMLLKSVAACLQTTARKTDVIARWGGEEFVVIAPETDTATAVELAKRLRIAIAALNVPGREKQPNGIVSVSIGVGTLHEHSNSARGLIAQADKALYQAKAQGRNTVCVAEGYVEDTASQLSATGIRRRMAAQ
jgi:two-component system, cell cycle response regulator